MKGIYFEIDSLAFGIACAFLLALFFVWKWRNQNNLPNPQLYFSDLTTLKDPHNSSPSWRVRFAALPQWLNRSALALFLLAFIDPHLQIAKSNQTPSDQHISSEGIAIYLVLDQSGSMKKKTTGIIDGKTVTLSKIDLLKEKTEQFIKGDPQSGQKGRPNDLIGLVTFARSAKILSPLTLDHAYILKQLAKLNVVQDRNQDGTGIGYAIFKTANLISATRYYSSELSKAGNVDYDIKSAVMIVVTDGLQDPNPLDKGNRLRNIGLKEAAEYAKEKNIRVYIINIEPRFETAEFAPHRRLMQQVAELTGGKFYLKSSNNLPEIYAEIDALEKSTLPDTGDKQDIPKDKQPYLYRRVSFYPYLIALGMLLLLLSVALDTTLLKRVP
jgi:Ca-activated chloride channel family protein